MEKLKGIQTKLNKRTNDYSYRVNTKLNNKMFCGPWGSKESAIQLYGEIQTQRIDQVKRNQHTKIENDITFGELVEQLENYLIANGYKDTWAKSHTEKLTRFFGSLFLKRVSTITEDDLKTLLRSNISKSYGNHIRLHLKTAIEFSNEKGIPFNPNLNNISKFLKKALKPNRVRDESLSAIDIAILFKWIDEKIQKGSTGFYFFKLAVILATYNACRRGEVMALRKKHFDFSKRKLTIEDTAYTLPNSYVRLFRGHTKNGKTRCVPMHDYVFNAFKLHFENNPDIKDNDLIFDFNPKWAYDFIKKAKKEKIQDSITKEIVPVLNRKFCFHSLRHTFATLFIKKHQNENPIVMLQTLQSIMGHSSPNMALRYVHAVAMDNPNIMKGLSFNESKLITESSNKDFRDRFEAIIKGKHLSDEEFKAMIKKLVEEKEDDD